MAPPLLQNSRIQNELSVTNEYKRLQTDMFNVTIRK